MGEPHVISALRDKRAEISGEILKLEKDIAQRRAERRIWTARSTVRSRYGSSHHQAQKAEQAQNLLVGRGRTLLVARLRNGR